MLSVIALSEIVACAGTGAGTLYLSWKRLRTPGRSAVIHPQNEGEALSLQSKYGYNEHSFVGVGVQAEVWVDALTGGIVSFNERGKVWVAAGEPLGRDEDLAGITARFLAHARARKRIVAFLPTTEKFAKSIASRDVRIVKVGASPYFDLQKWNPRGNSAKKLRSGVNHARRAGISVEEVSNVTEEFRREAESLSQEWSDHRRAGVHFGWLFELAPFRYSAARKYFAARTPDGKLQGLIAASPIPARAGWYLEDVLRSVDSPSGTSDILVFEALTSLAACGVRLATLGTVPLSEKGSDCVSVGHNFLVERSLKFSRRHLTSLYNFKGLGTFKSKFVPSWWEGEYVIVSKGVLISPRVANAILSIIVPGGLFQILQILLSDSIS